MDAPADNERIRQHADLVYRTCLRITGNAQDAADVAQEVFVAWLRSHREIRGSVAAWLYGTARQRALDWLRSRHRRDHHELQAGAMVDQADPSDTEWRGQLDEALNELSVATRTLVIEHHLMGLTQGDLARRHRCTQATISRRLAQALDLLRTALQTRGVTVAGALLVSGLAATRANACPPALVLPVQAQAQVVGASALVGPPVVGGLGLLGWSAVVAGLLFLLALLGGAGLWWWSVRVAHELDRDWTAVATAHLPPVDPAIAVVVRTPDPGPRYPSIEALIVRLPPLEVERQARLERLVAPTGGSPWSWTGTWPATSIGSMTSTLMKGEPLSEVDTKLVQRFRERLDPILAALRGGGVALGGGIHLAQAYADGQLTGSQNRNLWLRSQLGIDQLTSRAVESVLIHAAYREADPRAALADLDAWVDACTRSTVTLIEAMVAHALWESRDRCYQELAWRGRLPPDILQRWLAESCHANATVSNGLLGDLLLLQIPLLDDLRAGRETGQGLIGYFDYLSQGRDLVWLAEHIDIIQEVLAGRANERFRALTTQESMSGLTPSYWPTVVMENDLAALSETRHHAYRLSVEILLRTRAGEPLPERLATLPSHGGNAWDLHYERLSATRFLLQVDAEGALPTAVRPEQAAAIRAQVGKARSKPQSKPLVNQQVLMEMEVTPPTPATRVEEPAEPVFPVRLEDGPEPPFPSVAQ